MCPQTVAAKILSEGVNAATAQELRKEVDFLRKCTHPNIVSYYGCLVYGRMVWILTEYCGKDLQFSVEEGKKVM